MGGSSKPQVIQTEAPVDNSLELERLQQQERAAARAREEEAARNAQQAQLQQATDARNRVFGTGADNPGLARQRIYQAFTDAGGDYRQFDSDIERALATQASSINSLDSNPDAYITDDWINNIVSGRQSAIRNQRTQQVDSLYSPTWATSQFGDNADDDIINSILGSSYNDTLKSVDAARSRGNLDDVGYSRALGKLNEQQTAARSTAQTLGGNVLQSYRTGLQGLVDNTRNSAAQSGFGGFNLDDFTGQINNKLGSYQQSLAGDVTNALQGQQFFDIGSILGSAGQAQGAVNPSPNDAAILAQRESQKQQTRGLGGSGVF